MAMISATIRDTQNNSFGTAMNGGTIRAYNGTVPTNEATALSGNTLLAQGTLNATAYQNSSAGVMVSNAITGANAVASGTPTFYRQYASDGTTCVCQMNTSECVVTPAAITSGVAVTWGAITHTNPRGL